jgi:hypothetical protein
MSRDIELMPDIFAHNHFNSNTDSCDMLVGPCACGATHSPGEWQLTRITPNDTPHAYGKRPHHEALIEPKVPKHAHLTDDVSARQAFPRNECRCSDVFISLSWLHQTNCPEYAPQFINGG